MAEYRRFKIQLIYFSGSFDVRLKHNSYGCKNKIIKDSIINIYGPIGAFIISDTVVCEGDTVYYNQLYRIQTIIYGILVME